MWFARLILFTKRKINQKFDLHLSSDSVTISLFNFVFLYGDFQSGKYFMGFECEIKDFLRKCFLEACKREVPKNVRKEKKTVVQLRRGDYTLKNNKETIGLLSDTYFNKALKHAKRENIYLVSDSGEYPVGFFDKKYQISHYSAGELGDFCLMMSADCLIVSNSTFAWWAGFLSGNEVIAPSPWYRELNSDLGKFPSEWRRLNSTFER